MPDDPTADPATRPTARGRWGIARTLAYSSVCVAAALGLAWLARDTWNYGPIREKVRQLRNEDVLTRRDAARVLGALRPEQVTIAAPALAAALADEDAEVRREAARALGSAPFAVTDPRGSLAAATALGRALEDPSAAVREGAAQAIGALTGRLAVEPPTALIDALEGDTSEQVRAASAWSLGVALRGHDAAVPALLDGLEDDAASVRKACDSALARRAFELSSATVRLVCRQLATARDARVRQRAATVLAATPAGPDAEAAFDALVGALDAPPGTPPPPLRDATPAPTVVSRIASAAATGSEAELPACWDPACEAARFLGRVASRCGRERAAVKALATALHSPHSWRRGAAAEGLFRIGGGAAPAVPDLAAALSESVVAERREGDSISSWAARALGAAAPGTADAPAAARALAAALLAKASGTRAYSAEALGLLGVPASASLPRLQELAGGPDRFVASKARQAIARIKAAS